MLIVGIDCATIATKTGLSLSEYANGVLTVRECQLASRKPSVAQQILLWIRNADIALLALDSPLGWPAAMGTVLGEHSAGAPIGIGSNELFRRHTDEVVRKTIGKNPLEVGADRIARTAVSALYLIDELAKLCGRKIVLAWREKLESGIYSIEVYPAGTLRSYEGSSLRLGGVGSRKKALLKEMIREGRLSLHPEPLQAIDNEHALDAVFCAIAAMDFVEGKAIHPKSDEEARAQKEGWI
jgi:predicted nuclease with RNAse H fold